MKPSDFTIVLNGLEKVGKAFMKRNKTEIKNAWRNSSLNGLSKLLVTSAEEKLSSAIALSSNPSAVTKTAIEVKERVSMVTEGIKQYTAYSLKQKKAELPNIIDKELDIDHAIISENLAHLENGTEKTIKVDDSLSNEALKSSSKTSGNINHTERNDQGMAIDISTSKPIIESSSKKVSQEFVKQILEETKPKRPKSLTLQKLSESSRERKVPSSQFGRIASYSGLIGGLVFDAATEVTKRTLGLKPAKTSEVSSLISDSPFLTEASAKRIADTLCKVRGAALKLGQMLSIQDNAMINPQLAAIFERVRQSADHMPVWQMERVMKHEFGSEWKDKFLEFDSKPFAAASIGQVHRAKLLDGTEVALKIQYPGVAKGIESDIKTIMGIVNTLNIFPKGVYLENVMSVAKRELSKEVDYLNETKAGIKFRELVEPYPEYYVPRVYEDFSTSNILTTELVYGVPVDKLEDSDQTLRNMVCEKLLKLCLLEIFLFRFMQTDPNWANFFYNSDTNQIILLDFGACNSYTPEFVDTYMSIIKAAADQNRENVLHYSQELGFLTGYETKVMEEAHVDAVMILGEAFACKGIFSFKDQDMTNRIHQLVPIMLKHRLTPPPEETYSLHRKMSGIFLLCTKLGAQINCSRLFDDVYDEYLSRKQTAKIL